MEGLLLILIPVALILLLGLAGLMLVDFALLGGDRRLEEREKERRFWRPPFVRGAELVAWAREKGAAAVRRALDRGIASSTPGALSEEVHAGADRAMLPDMTRRDAAETVPCPAGGQGTIGVTAPEAIAIAEHIQRELPQAEQEEILRRARANAADLPYAAARGDTATPCALQGGDCVCLTYRTRPLRCRPLHATELLQRLDRRTSDLHEEAARTAHAKLVAEGIEEGYAGALETLGLDGNVYELNSALAVALSMDDVARRWLNAEPVFSDCAPGPGSVLA
ncbi:MAG: hypothetical protein R3304_09775 [Longimicrobiales bacterium]|nr:hypothetical protein [Longimicrobiales bacterium]